MDVDTSKYSSKMYGPNIVYNTIKILFILLLLINKHYDHEHQSTMQEMIFEIVKNMMLVLTSL